MTQEMLRDAQSEEFEIAAGEYMNVPESGEFVRCTESSADFEISVNNGSRLFFASGLSYRPPNMDGFENFQIWNTTDDTLTVKMSWGAGVLEDNRLTASANLKVVNPTGEKLNVDDAAAQALLTAIDTVLDTIKTDTAAILAMQQNPDDQRAPQTTLENATEYTATNTETVIATIAENTAGVHVRRCPWANNGASNKGGLEIDGVKQWPVTNLSGDYGSGIDHDIFVPAGKKVAIRSYASGIEITAWAEVKE